MALAYSPPTPAAIPLWLCWWNENGFGEDPKTNRKSRGVRTRTPWNCAGKSRIFPVTIKSAPASSAHSITLSSSGSRATVTLIQSKVVAGQNFAVFIEEKFRDITAKLFRGRRIEDGCRRAFLMQKPRNDDICVQNHPKHSSTSACARDGGVYFPVFFLPFS